MIGVTQQVDFQRVFVSEFPVPFNRIGADPEYNTLSFLEFPYQVAELRCLGCAPGRIIFRIGIQDNPLPSELREFTLAAILIRQRERRNRVPCLENHLYYVLLSQSPS